VLVLTPTRELAIQVAEAFQRYAAHLQGFHVLPIYGGQPYDGQLRALRRGVHVVVGTPGRVMDHMRRRTLRLDKLNCLVLDEADEMLRMGFIDDVDWILQQTPPERQTALFSATMPEPIRRIAARHLRDPEHIAIEERATVADTIHQHHWMVSGRQNKIDALTRILEAESFDGVLVFVRTRIMTVELAEKLQARGYASACLSGDMPQKRREQTVEKLKNGQLDILVATDVAARGLDIERISHVINFDIPADAESYIHRIGRTGRAGRSGKAILLVAPRERRLLSAIERATRQKIALLELPSTEMINDQRIARFKQALTDVLSSEDLGVFRMVLEQYRQEHNVAALEMASALARMVQGDEPLLLAADVDHGRRYQTGRSESRRGEERPEQPPSKPGKGMERFRVEVGHAHGIQPGNLVGAITNEASLSGTHIGRIDIYDDYSTIDLPEGMRHELFDALKKVRVRGQRLRLSSLDGERKYGGKKGFESKGKKPKRKKDLHRNRKKRPK
jgi:ATP-dependent RNA helicase DeaD